MWRHQARNGELVMPDAGGVDFVEAAFALDAAPDADDGSGFSMAAGPSG